MAEGPGVSMEEVMRLIATMSAEQHKNMLEAIAEMKKPTAREQEKIDKEDAKIRQQQENRIKLAKAEEDRKKNTALGCSHSTFHPGTGVVRSAWRAQVHTPAGEKPYFVPTCIICQTQLPKILATNEMLSGGVNLDQYMGLDADKLRKWAEQSQVA